MQETLSDETSKEIPEYKLGMAEEERTTFVGKDPTDMTFATFRTEYEAAMMRAAETEKYGALDPHADGYLPMTDDDRLLMAEDWKAFSRTRGYTEEEIVDYERWLELSGQKQGVPGAKNDPWRRPGSTSGDMAASVYLKLLQHRIDEGKRPLSPEVLQSKEETEDLQSKLIMPFDDFPMVPQQPPTVDAPGKDQDIW